MAIDVDLNEDAPIPDLQLRSPSASNGGLAGQVYEELREAICDFRIAPNQRLVQNLLAEQLGISRTPVRDALLHLAQEGLVQPAPFRGGFLVTEFTPNEVLEIYDVRLALEPLAASQAAGRHTRTQIAEMRDVNMSIGEQPATSVREHFRLNGRFHELVVEPCNNMILKRMLTQLWGMPSSLRMYHHQFGGGELMAALIEGHESIIEALTLGDADLVDERVRDHVNGARQTALEHFEDEAG